MINGWDTGGLVMVGGLTKCLICGNYKIYGQTCVRCKEVKDEPNS
jgi:ribosomal protein L32